MEESKFCCCKARIFLISLFIICLIYHVILLLASFSTKHPEMFVINIVASMAIIVFFMIGTCMRNPCILLVQLILCILECVFLIFIGIGFFIFGSTAIGWLIDQPDEKGKKGEVVMSTFVMIFLAVCYFIGMIFSIAGAYLTYLVFSDAKRYKALPQGY